MLCSAIAVAFAQFLWKASGGTNLVLLAVGIFLYGASSLLMIIAYRFGSLSVLHPILSTSYGLGLAISYFILKEPISWLNILGVMMIIFGVALIGGGDAD